MHRPYPSNYPSKVITRSRCISRFVRVIDQERVAQLVKLIIESPKYTIENALRDYGLLKGEAPGYPQFMIPCPFHEDAAPSMNINIERDMYQCFSCGEGGGYFKFLMTYSEKVKGIKISYYNLLERLLKDSPQLQAQLGFRSIYVQEFSKVIDLKIPRFNKTNVVEYPTTFRGVINAIKKDRSKGMEDKIRAIALIQHGLTPTAIYEDIFSTIIESPKESLTELISSQICI